MRPFLSHIPANELIVCSSVYLLPPRESLAVMINEQKQCQRNRRSVWMPERWTRERERNKSRPSERVDRPTTALSIFVSRKHTVNNAHLKFEHRRNIPYMHSGLIKTKRNGMWFLRQSRKKEILIIREVAIWANVLFYLDDVRNENWPSENIYQAFLNKLWSES